MKVTKAVILTAGYSTRFLPSCKNIPKAMLPLVDVPIIHEIAKECVEGGIKDIIIVTSYGNHPLEDYFDNNKEMEDFLKDTGKMDRYERFKEVYNKVNVACIRQNKSLPYGNGSPVLAAKPFLNKDEAFAIFFADDLVLGGSAIGEAKKKFEEMSEKDSNIGGVIVTQEVPDEEVGRYGIVSFKDEKKKIVDRVIEKPELKDAPSRQAVYGRYIATYEIFNYFTKRDVGKAGELWLSDAFDRACKERNFYQMNASGEWLTTGDPLRYMKAMIRYALERDEYKEDLMKFMKDLSS
jgi:UTP--glucose-1-phosphate uridylyltransferase